MLRSTVLEPLFLNKILCGKTVPSSNFCLNYTLKAFNDFKSKQKMYEAMFFGI